MHGAALDRVREGSDDMLLANHVGERARAMATVERRAGGH